MSSLIDALFLTMLIGVNLMVLVVLVDLAADALHDHRRRRNGW